MNSLVSAVRSLRTSSLSLQLRGISGTVKFFNVKKGWGILSTKEDPPKEVFVHQSSVAMDGFRFLEQGQEVEFEVRQTERGVQAANVTAKGGKPVDRRDL